MKVWTFTFFRLLQGVKKYKKYLIRLVVALLVWVFFHVNSSPVDEEIMSIGALDQVYIFYTVFVVLIIWQVLDFAMAKVKADTWDLGQYRNIIKLFIILTLVSSPLVIASTWFSEFVMKAYFKECCNLISVQGFVKMTFQAQVLAWLIIAERILQIYHTQSQRSERDKALMQKELLQSKYVNLKNQVNPHFLFNSFSVLQSLIDTKPTEASRFLDRLSKMYRYMLDNREESMSSLEKELGILDLYMYLLKIRHEESLQLRVHVDEQFYDRYIPTLSLQMLVENAVKHNQFSKKEPLIVSIFIENEFLVVKNKVKKKGASEDSTKLGLENIRSQYNLQTEKSVIITEDEQFFTVKLPVLSSLRLT